MLARDDAEQDRRVDLHQLPAHPKRDDCRNDRNKYAKKLQNQPAFARQSDRIRGCATVDCRYEGVQAETRHETGRRNRQMALARSARIEPAEGQARDQRTAAGAERDFETPYMRRQSSDQQTGQNPKAEKDEIGHIRGTQRGAELFGGVVDRGLGAVKRGDIAPLQPGFGRGRSTLAHTADAFDKETLRQHCRGSGVQVADVYPVDLAPVDEQVAPRHRDRDFWRNRLLGADCLRACNHGIASAVEDQQDVLL